MRPPRSRAASLTRERTMYADLVQLHTMRSRPSAYIGPMPPSQFTGKDHLPCRIGKRTQDSGIQTRHIMKNQHISRVAHGR